MDNEFEQNHYDGTAKSIHGIEHDSIRLMKWMA